MSQPVLINFRVEEEDKKGMELVCSELGLSMSTAFNLFVKKVVREKRIPFELSIDPFYSEENLARLNAAIADAKQGKKMHEHELIEG